MVKNPLPQESARASAQKSEKVKDPFRNPYLIPSRVSLVVPVKKKSGRIHSPEGGEKGVKAQPHGRRDAENGADHDAFDKEPSPGGSKVSFTHKNLSEKRSQRSGPHGPAGRGPRLPVIEDQLRTTYSAQRRSSSVGSFPAPGKGAGGHGPPAYRN